ncbi:MAG: hypothetical protein NTW86_04065, partial [Candidatus Sumerlaeota bacterium]|nr:hypothetical protein [Candidatus Sumerlaeota bacterium]
MAERTKGWKSFWSGRFRRRYSRKASRVSRAEKAIGVVILVLLAAIAAAVYVKGRRYNPALYALSEKSAAEIQGVARDLSRAGPYVPVGAGAAESPTANASPAPTGAKTEEVKAKAEGAPVLPLNLKLEGWAPRGKPEQFTADTLYEKIDGRADVYQKFDVQRLDFVSFANAANPDQFVDLYVYDMGEPRNAFGIYAAERTPGAPAVALGREGYEAGGSLYFWKGPYYNLILPSSPSDSSPAAAAERVAQAADALEADDLSPLPFADLLPADGRVADSLAYLKKDALSQSFLDEVVSAQYALGTGAPLLAFVRECKSAEEAASLLKQYQEYLDKYARPEEV